MGRTAKDNRDLPHPRPVERIELSWKNYKLRIVAAVVFLALGVGALTYTLLRFLGEEPGWQVIGDDLDVTESCAGDFTFLYELGAGGGSVRTEARTITAVYSQAAETAFRLFHARQSFEGVTNVWDLDQHPNETLTVDPVLYRAFQLVARYGDRSIYLGPVHEIYDGIFSCQEDWQAADFDPYTNGELADLFQQIAAFARDPDSVDVELLGDGQVRLKVSEAYLAFARENELGRFVDFNWMANAFIADYLADTLTAAGCTRGALSSYDGFIRDLDGRGTAYSLDILDRTETGVRVAAVMEYTGPMSLVSLRAWPAGAQDAGRYYETGDGACRTPYLDTADGKCRAAAGHLVCLGGDAGCAEILLRTIPAYVGETLGTEALTALAADGIHALWIDGTDVCHTDPDLSLTGLYSGYEARSVP